MTKNAVLQVSGVWKRYGLPLPQSVKKIRSLLRPPNPRFAAGDDIPWALQDIDLHVEPGESVGIIGRNGAGKSTLLKVLAGVTPPTQGQVTVRGRLFPMIELNAGLHMELTGRENVSLLGAFMGLTRKRMRGLMPEVEAFCELGEWFDRPVRMYSSGMLARLGFGVAMNVEADILLIDEVMAVGDLPFQRKSMARMRELHQSGATILFVTHNLRMVERLCTRAVCLRGGKVVLNGTPQEAVTAYMQAATAQKLSAQAGRVADIERNPDCLVQITAIELRNAAGERADKMITGESATIRVHYETATPVRDANLGIGITNEEQIYVSGFSNESDGKSADLTGASWFDCVIPLVTLLEGVYSITIKIRGVDGAVMGGCADLLYFDVYTPPALRLANQYGIVMTPVVWEVG